MQVDAALLHWEKRFECESNLLAKSNRKLLFQTEELQVTLINPQIKSKKKEPKTATVLLCNDLLIISSKYRKNDKFCGFRRKLTPFLHLISTKNLSETHDAASGSLFIEPTTEFTSITGTKSTQETIPGLKYIIHLSQTELPKFLKHLQSAMKPEITTKPSPIIQKHSSSTLPSPKFTDKPLGSFNSEIKSSENDSASRINQKVELIFTKLIQWYGTKDPLQKSKRGDLLINDSDTVKQNKNAHLLCLKVLQEIMRTEADYVNDLETITRQFILPIRITLTNNNVVSQSPKKTTSFITSDDFDTIFRHIESILEVNSELLHSLNQAIIELNSNSPSIERLTEVFVHEFEHVVPFLKMYSDYCHNYKNGLRSLQRLRETNPTFHKFVACQETKASVQLESLLIKPVQRICKYPLLFKELVKHMQSIESDVDVIFQSVVNKLSKTSRDIDKITQNVNEKVQVKENLDQVLEVYRELGGVRLDANQAKMSSQSKAYQEKLSMIPHPSRRYISSTNIMLREITGKNSKTRQKYVVYLFNNLLILAKINQNSMFGLTRNNSKHDSTSRQRRNSQGSKNSSMSSSQHKGKARLIHMFDFLHHTLRVKDPLIPVKDESGRCMFEIIVTYIDNQSTQLQKFELWCASKQEKQHLSHGIFNAISSCRQINDEREHRSRARTDDTRSTASVSDVPDVSPPTTLRAKRAASLKRTTTMLSESNSVNTLDQVAMNFNEQFKFDQNPLLQLERKYNVKSPKVGVIGGKTEVKVSFNEGLLGLVLLNKPLESPSSKKVRKNSFANGIGVFVGEVQKGGQAEKLGIQVDDRLVMMQGVPLGTDTSWKNVIECLPKLHRPLRMCFERVS